MITPRAYRTRVALSAPMTLLELAALLGKRPCTTVRRQLRREILRRQSRLRRNGHDVTLLHDDGPRMPGKVTLAQLRGYFPEWFDTRDEIVAAVTAEQKELRDGLEEVLGRTEILAARIKVMESELSTLRAALGRKKPEPS